VPVDEVAELLRRWREAGGAWSRGRVLLDAGQLAGRLTPEERRVVAAALADTGAPDLARQLETRTGQPVDATHLQAFADGLLELEGPRLDRVIAALEVADVRLSDDPGQPDDGRPPPPPPGSRPTTVTGEEEVLDERLRDLAALEHLGDEELQGIALGEIELGSQELGSQELGGQELGSQELGSQELGESTLGEVGLGPAPAIVAAPAPAIVAASAPATAVTREQPSSTDRDDTEPPAEPTATSATRDEDIAFDQDITRDEDLARDQGITPDAAAAPRQSLPPDDVALVPATAAPDELAPRAAADALTRLRARLAKASTATARLAALSSEATSDLDAPAALLLLEQVPAGWQRRRAATRLLTAGALTGVDPAALLARFPAARDRCFVAGDLLATSDLAVEDLAAELPPQLVRRLAIRAER
jgi:hypothetical protein